MVKVLVFGLLLPTAMYAANAPKNDSHSMKEKTRAEIKRAEEDRGTFFSKVSNYVSDIVYDKFVVAEGSEEDVTDQKASRNLSLPSMHNPRSPKGK